MIWDTLRLLAHDETPPVTLDECGAVFKLYKGKKVTDVVKSPELTYVYEHNIYRTVTMRSYHAIYNFINTPQRNWIRHWAPLEPGGSVPIWDGPTYLLSTFNRSYTVSFDMWENRSTHAKKLSIYLLRERVGVDKALYQAVCDYRIPFNPDEMFQAIILRTKDNPECWRNQQ